MDYIQEILKIVITILIFIVMTKVYMAVANYVGEKLGIGQFLIALCRKARKNK